jgi:alpha-mannosidase
LLAVSDAPGCRQLTREIRLVDGQDSVEIANTVDKLPVRAKEGVHFGFAFRVPKGTLRMDVPFAVVRPEADQIAGSCKNWFTVQRWMDLAGGDGGVTWASADAPLVEVGELTATLIGSQKNARAWLAHAGPAQRFYSWVMNNHWHTNYRAEQEGPVVFRYAVRPHRGYDPLAAARFGIAFSQPLSVSTAARALPPRLTVEPPDAIVAAFKPSDDRQAFIVRLFGAGGKTVQARLHWSDPVPADVWLSDLSERPLQRVQGTVEVPAWGVVTLRATPAP